MYVPRHTHRLILAAMPRKGAVSGRRLRRQLNRGVPWWKFWRRWGLVGFYAAMARLEKDRLVQGFYPDAIVSLRHYCLTWNGYRVAELPMKR